MTSARKKIPLFFTALFALMLTTSGQASIELNFQGLLTGTSGEKLTNESFEFTAKLISSEPGNSVLWNYSSTTTTDEDGWLTFSIPEISQYLNMEEEDRNSIVISLEFTPNSNTKWLSQGENFLVTYALIPSMKDETIYLKMSRMDSSELTVHLEDHLYAFKDDYPYAYLTSGFLLTDSPPLTKSSLDDLRQWISPDSSENDPASRGVKGGFPKGGYHKR